MAPDIPNKRETAEELKRIKEEAKIFSNPLIGSATEQLSALSPKERRSIKKGIATRQAKIVKILGEFEAASTPDALKELLSTTERLEEMMQLLGEQAEIAEEKSRGTIASQPFKESVLAAREFGHAVLEKTQAKEPFVPADLIRKLRELILSAGEQTRPAPDATSQESSGETNNKGEEPERKQETVQKTPTFDDIQTVESLVERLRNTSDWKTEIEYARNKPPDTVTNQDIAKVLEKRMTEFEAMCTAKDPKIEQEAKRFVSVFVNPSLRDAVRRVLIAKGYLTPRTPITPRSTEQQEAERMNTPHRFSDIQTLNELDRFLLDGTTELDVLVEKKRRWLKSEEVAAMIYNKVSAFDKEKKKNGIAPQQEIQGFLSLFGNEEVREAIQRAFADRGLLESSSSAPRVPVEGVPQQVSGDRRDEKSKPREESFFGPALREFLSTLREKIHSPEYAKKGQELGIAYGQLVGRFQYFCSEAFAKKGIQERRREVEEFLSAASPRFHDALKRVIEEDKIVEGVGQRIFFTGSETKSKEARPNMPPVSSVAQRAFRTPEAPKAPEVQKTPEARRAEALEQYFGEVESGMDLLQKIVEMPSTAALQKAFGSPEELNRLSGELMLRVLEFFDLVDSWDSEKRSRGEIGKSTEDFIASAKIPFGCQVAFRTIMRYALHTKLGPVVETLKAPPKVKPDAFAPKPPPEGGVGISAGIEAPRSGELSVEEIVASAKAMKAAKVMKAAEDAKAKITASVGAGAKTSSETSEKPTQTTSSAEREQRPQDTFLERLRLRAEGRKRASSPTPATSPAAPLKPEATSTVPSSPKVESVPIAPALVSEKANEGWTREKIEALTFENLAGLSDDDLQTAFKDIGFSIWLAIAVHGMPEDFIRKVRGFAKDTEVFDEWVKKSDSPEEIIKGRGNILMDVKFKLLMALQEREKPPKP